MLKETSRDNKFKEPLFETSIYSMYNIFENCKIIYDYSYNKNIPNTYKNIINTKL